MRYRADLQVGGRVAGVGQRLLDSVGKAMSKQGLEAVSQSLTPPLEPPTGSVPQSAEAGTELAAASPAFPPATRRGRLTLYLIVAILLALVLVALL
jgi:hypothetical protein